MITDNDIVFITTAIPTKWLDLSQQIIEKLFPGSDRHVVLCEQTNKFYGTGWFNWIDVVKKSKAKYYIRVDEDCFLLSKERIFECINHMEKNNIDLLGCPDRNMNTYAMNPFFLIGKCEHLQQVPRDKNQLKWRKWKRNYKNMVPKPEWLETQRWCNNESFYGFFWWLLEKKTRFGYLFPHQDTRFSSTNPRVNPISEDICIHMWHARDCGTLEHSSRYEAAAAFVKNKLNL